MREETDSGHRATTTRGEARPSLTDQELRCLVLSKDLWTLFASMPDQHPSDRPEMAAHVHAIQALILQRPTVRELGWLK